MFQNIANGPGWKMDGPMLWGYFFTDESPERLELAAGELQRAGYRVVDLFEADAEDGEDAYFYLHVEREEIHSPQSLHERNTALYAFADQQGLASYDGMDVGPVQASPR
ncbi:ribonuclease E inhibitor RraB [Albitalea terrae]|uniref:Ribonuclease E inhibitor RraB n=2 Tax=Piscinibacter terrae TaxID=2496871 RepID=A0A3N7HWR2_9BURK|nr:ribonuclease E inhibitor RraB [Albitalea terrae]